MKKVKRLSVPLAVYALVFICFALRIFRIDAVPLRGDEAFSMLNWTGPPSVVLRDIAPIDPQPPLAFIGLWAWVKLAGSTALAARYYSTLWSVLTIAPLYQIGRRLAGKQVGILAALLWAFSPFQIWHAQDIRAYTLWPAFSVLGVWLLTLSLDSRKLTHRGAYVLATALAAYSFYTEAFIILFHNIYALWSLIRQRRSLWPWLATQLAIVTLLAPWYLQLPRLQAQGYSGTGPRLTTIGQLARAIPDTLNTLLFGFTLPNIPVWQTSLAAVALLILIGGIVILARRRTEQRFFLIAYTLLPLASLLALSTIGGFYRPRYLNGAAPAYLLMLAIVIANLYSNRKRVVRWSGPLLLGVFLSINLTAIANYHFNPKYIKAPNWPALTDALEASARADDMIIRNASDPAFDFYYAGNTAVSTIPSRPHPPYAESEAQLDAISAEFNRIWLIPTNHPFWDPENHAATYLEENQQLVVEIEVGRFQLQRWSPWQVSQSELVDESHWTIGGIAEVAGFDTIPLMDTDQTLHASAGETIVVIIFWQPLASSQQAYTVFTHLLGPPKPDGNILWAGRDHLPQFGRVSTATWADDGLLRDAFTITIPQDTPAGEFVISVGMYDAETGERLPVSNPQGETAGDSIPLLSVTIHK